MVDIGKAEHNRLLTVAELYKVTKWRNWPMFCINNQLLSFINTAHRNKNNETPY